MAALKIENLITDHLDLWTAAVRPKSSAGRGSNSKLELTGIKKLRELILELAVRGKLVPQDPSDEPASVLLERIAAAKARLVKEGKIKKLKALPEIAEEEKPFELPEGWECIRLGELTSKMGSGSTPRGGQSAYVSEGIPFLRSQNVWNEGLRLDDVVYIDENTHLKMEGTKVIPGDVLLNITGASLGRTLIFPDSIKEANVSQHVTIIRLLIDELAPFVHLGIKSPLVQNLIWGRQVGMAIEGLSKRTLELFEFPVPPLAEQHRIVAKVDELMALCDQLEQCSESLLAAHQTLVETLLATLTDSGDADELAQNWARLSTHFDTLFTTEASIDALKQTILQLAVMGKLVPQDPSDEPASVLLERIVAEKAKLVKEGIYQKTSKLLPKKNIELPSGWVSVQIGELCPSIVPNRDKPKTFSGTIPWVTLPSFPVDSWYLDSKDIELGLTTEEVMEYSARIIPSNSVLMSCVGRFGLSAINTIPVSSNQQVHAFIVLNGLSPEYLSCVIRVVGSHLYEIASATTIAYINKTKCESIQFGLPPAGEQFRIVAKVDELMTLCDQLKSRLQTSQQTQLALAESLVEGALV
ncbi:restriction endonuclease subunit S [Aeromonas sobria]|uniref:Type I restriction endonuclease subunit S n=1 Tax=Aeromonas sobria TaxID=646 RepID=A0A1S2CP59_AERSO|nr:restriction endonuclease subunit S [Aeromonas sobria]OHY90502.1 type I restriction endonuclease subunit S [Aeromonas sobria]